MVSEKTAMPKPPKGKSKDPPAPPPLVNTTVPENPNVGEVYQRLLKGLAITGGVSAGVGGGLAGVHALLSHRQRLFGQPPVEPDPAVMAVPYPQVPEKLAADIPVGGPEFLAGRHAENQMQVPWAGPAYAAAAVLPALASSAGVNKLLHHIMKSRQQNELQKSQKDYDDTMLGMYNPEHLQKLPEKTAAALDNLFDVFEKVAGKKPSSGPKNTGQGQGSSKALPPDFGVGSQVNVPGKQSMGLPFESPHPATLPTPPPPLPNTPRPKKQKPEEPLTTPHSLGTYGGAAATLAALLGVSGAYGGYKWMEDRKPENLLDEAVQERAINRARSSPEPIMVRPISRQISPAAAAEAPQE